MPATGVCAWRPPCLCVRAHATVHARASPHECRYYPEFVSAIVVVNAPRVVNTLYNTLKSFISPGMRARITMETSSSSTAAAVQRLVPARLIPTAVRSAEGGCSVMPSSVAEALGFADLSPADLASLLIMQPADRGGCGAYQIERSSRPIAPPPATAAELVGGNMAGVPPPTPIAIVVPPTARPLPNVCRPAGDHHAGPVAKDAPGAAPPPREEQPSPASQIVETAETAETAEAAARETAFGALDSQNSAANYARGERGAAVPKLPHYAPAVPRTQHVFATARDASGAPRSHYVDSARLRAYYVPAVRRTHYSMGAVAGTGTKAPGAPGKAVGGEYDANFAVQPETDSAELDTEGCSDYDSIDDDDYDDDNTSGIAGGRGIADADEQRSWDDTFFDFLFSVDQFLETVSETFTSDSWASYMDQFTSDVPTERTSPTRGAHASVKSADTDDPSLDWGEVDIAVLDF